MLLPRIPRRTDILTHLPPPNDQLLTTLQDEKHPRPFRPTHVPPPMIRTPLHRHIPSPQHPRHPFIQYHLHLPFDHDAIIQSLRAMHDGFTVRREIHDARDGARGVGKTQLLGGEEGVVRVEISIGGEGGGTLGGGVDDVEGYGVVEVVGPLSWTGGVYSGAAGGSMACDVVG